MRRKELASTLEEAQAEIAALREELVEAKKAPKESKKTEVREPDFDEAWRIVRRDIYSVIEAEQNPKRRSNLATAARFIGMV